MRYNNWYFPVLLWSAACLVPSLSSALGYEAVDLGEHTYFSDINENGQVVGTRYIKDAGGHEHTRAVIYDGSLRDLGTLGGQDSSAYAINNNGQVVGESTTLEGKKHAFLYDGKMHDIGVLAEGESHAFDINDAGQVVGSFDSGNEILGFVYDGVLRKLADGYSPASVINQHGWVIGQGEAHWYLFDGTLRNIPEASWLSGINSDGKVVGCGNGQAILFDGAVHYLGVPVRGETSWAVAINDAGQIIIESGTEVPLHGNWHEHPKAFLYDGAMRNLGTLGGRSASPRAINALGQVVGSSETRQGKAADWHAFLYDGTRMLDINRLVSPIRGVVFVDAFHITDSGYILVRGQSAKAVSKWYLLKPKAL